MNTEYTATEVVKDMYNTYPEVDFIDERYTDDNATVDLIFDMSRVDADGAKPLLDKITNEYGCKYRIKGNKLIVTAIEDDEYYLDDTDYDMTERHEENLKEMWYNKTSAADGWFTSAKADEIFKNSGFTKDQIIPTMEEIYHIYQAKEKCDSGATRGCGINYNSIQDPYKYAKYVYAASVLPHEKYLSKTWYQSPWDRPRTPNGDRFDDALFNVINYYGLSDTTLKSQFDQYLIDREKLEKEKEAKRQARAARKATTGSASATTTTATNPGTITKYNWDAGVYFPDNVFQKVINDGCNVNIDRIINKDSNRGIGGTSRSTNKISKITITDKDTGALLYEDEIKVSSPGGNFDEVKIYTGSEFRNLPERQFSAWLKRKVDQVRNAPIGNPTDDATEVEDAETMEVQDED